MQAKIAGVLGSSEGVITIHGGTGRDERLRLQELFRSDPAVHVLVATDAAGEGVNLQTAHLMVNYDLPWNPNRLEQRFGRIHRIGQTEVCHLWNLVAAETREGEVYHRLLVKLENEGRALDGRVFDILGEVFDNTPLKELLMEAIRNGDSPEVRARLKQRIESAFDPEHVASILERNALAQETMTPERLYAVRSEMEKAEARKLQPYFVRSFFIDAFKALGGSIHPRESGRHEINYVPAAVRDQDRKIRGRNLRHPEPVVTKYARVCFTKDAVRLDKPNTPEAVLLHPGHPLLRAVTDLLLEQYGGLLRQGAILVDPSEEAAGPRLVFLLTHEIRDGLNEVVSQRLQFVSVGEDGQASSGGWAPHLDLDGMQTRDQTRDQGRGEDGSSRQVRSHHYRPQARCTERLILWRPTGAGPRPTARRRTECSTTRPTCGWSCSPPISRGSSTTGLVALYDNLVALPDVRETESRTVAAAGDSVADALRALLAEALFLFDTQGFLAAGATVTVEGGASVEEGVPTAVRAELYGEPLDRDRHELLAEVKAVTFHRLQAEALPDGGWRATVLLDV